MGGKTSLRRITRPMFGGEFILLPKCSTSAIQGTTSTADRSSCRGCGLMWNSRYSSEFSGLQNGDVFDAEQFVLPSLCGFFLVWLGMASYTYNCGLQIANDTGAGCGYRNNKRDVFQLRVARDSGIVFLYCVQRPSHAWGIVGDSEAAFGI